MARSAAASFAWLFETHSSGRIGSPIVAGSSTRRRSSSNAGSATVSAGRPLPGRRTTPDSAPGSSRSFRPRPIVLRATPVARAAALIPPCPAARASAAANNRRPRSSKLRRTATYRPPIADASTIARAYAVANHNGILTSQVRNIHQPSRFRYSWASPRLFICAPDLPEVCLAAAPRIQERPHGGVEGCGLFKVGKMAGAGQLDVARARDAVRHPAHSGRRRITVQAAR